VPDQQVREDSPVLARDDALEVALDLYRIVQTRQPQSLRQPADVRVDDDALGLAELGGDDVRGLARDARQPRQLLERPRNLAVELLDQHLHRPAQRLRLLAEEAGRADVVLQLLDRHREIVLGTLVLAEQRLSDAVHAHVGRLCRQHHRHEQLEIGAEAESDGRIRVGGR